MVDYLVAYQRVLAGGRRPFDERYARDIVRRDIERARNYPSVQNHELIEGAEPQGVLSAVSVPTLVVHGTADPLFRVEHGEALARAIPDERGCSSWTGPGTASSRPTGSRSPRRSPSTPAPRR